MRSRLFAAVLAFVGASLAQAATYVVNPGGNIQTALNSATAAGDVVLIKAGVYNGHFTVAASGTSANPIIIQGEAGTILDGSLSTNPTWTAATDIGTGVYRATGFSFTPFQVTAGGKVLTQVTESKCDATTDPYYWPTFFASGFPAHGWAGVKGISMWRTSSTPDELLVRFDGATNPTTLQMTVSPRTPIITINNKSHITIRNLAFRNASDGVKVGGSGQTCANIVIENCKMSTVEWGISLLEGTDQCKLRYNEISYDPLAGADPYPEASWENWQVVKGIGESNRMGIMVHDNSRGGHQIHNNYIHDGWDGINLTTGNANTTATASDVYSNYIFRTFDNAVKLSYRQVGTKFHDNVIEWTRRGVRISEISAGPLYIYKNIFLQGKSGNLVVYCSGSNQPTAEVWVYHNTCSSDNGINLDLSSYSGTYPLTAYHFYNNLFWCGNALGKNVSYNPNWPGSNYNIYFRADAGDRPWTTEINYSSSAWNTAKTNQQAFGADANALWDITDNAHLAYFTDPANRDLSLKSTSPARAYGLDLSTIATLPGCAAGYFSGVKPDVGALQYGQPMPQLLGIRGITGIEMLSVGNAGNADDTTATKFDYNGAAGAGGVAYGYKIAKCEITVGQWVQFLNIVDPTGGNARTLWHTSHPITRTLTNPNGQRYAANSGTASQPIGWISWNDAARFCNYLTSGDTELGAYNTTTWTVNRSAAQTSYGRVYAIGTIDEWYKAAYHDGTSLLGTAYRDFPFTGSVAITKANYNLTYSPTHVADVGTFAAWPGTYGTLDQGGNLAEWTEEPDPLNAARRLFLGGMYNRGSGDMVCNYERVQYATTDDAQITLRVVSLP